MASRLPALRPSTRLAATCVSAVSALALLMSPPLATALSAQASGPPKWKSTVEASGTVLYGAVNQRIGSMAVSVQHMDGNALFKMDLQAGYGDGKKNTELHRSVVVRNIRFAVSTDMRRRDRVSPYTFATALTNYQQRISTRYDAGAGARIIVWRADSVRSGFPEEATVTASILGERTVPISVNNAPVVDNSRFRWSLQASYRKRISPTLRFTHNTLYQPSIQEPSRHTLEATTVLAAPIVGKTELTVTHRERIDSEAVERGAPSRRDGQVLFGVRTSF